MKSTYNTYCDILKEVYLVNDRTVTCTLNCKINLEEFERAHFSFSESFIRTKLSNWLPTIKTIYNYTLKNPVVAKFYTLPLSYGNTAKVLEFNQDYYRKIRKYKEEDILTKGSIVHIKDIPGVCIKNGEIGKWEYCETFKVTSTATCHQDDTFDENKGKLIAMNKALMSLNKHNIGMLNTIKELVAPVNNGIDSNIAYMNSVYAQLTDNINSFKENQ